MSKTNTTDAPEKAMSRERHHGRTPLGGDVFAPPKDKAAFAIY